MRGALIRGAKVNGLTSVRRTAALLAFRLTFPLALTAALSGLLSLLRLVFCNLLAVFPRLRFTWRLSVRRLTVALPLTFLAVAGLSIPGLLAVARLVLSRLRSAFARLRPSLTLFRLLTTGLLRLLSLALRAGICLLIWIALLRLPSLLLIHFALHGVRCRLQLRLCEL